MKVVIAHGGNIGFHGGGTNRVLAFAKALAENGHEVYLVVPEPKGEVPYDIKKLVKIYSVPVKARSLWDQAFRAVLVSLKAKKLAEKEKAILQIEHSTLGGIAASLGCSNYVLDIHDLEFDGPLYKSIPFAPKVIYALEKKAVRKARKIIVVSKPMKDLIVNEWNVPEEKIVIIPNGYFSKKLEKFNAVTVDEKEGLISFLGVLTHNVDYNKIISLAKSRKDAHIHVIGDGPMRTNFINKIKRENVKNVMLHGFLPDDEAYSILAKSQVCIFPLINSVHTRVSMHMKTLDYAALGRAIATDRDATARIFEEHGAALVSDPANPDEFIGNVHRLLDDGSLRKRLGEKARIIVKNFTWEKQGEKLVKMYENMGGLEHSQFYDEDRREIKVFEKDWNQNSCSNASRGS
ncbi:MAG: glycosyltransferase family 4 protein [Nitrososphaerota archaeon]|nr:glycosyltransferase family 4 protein [Nitrososphaerota archaeon]